VNDAGSTPEPDSARGNLMADKNITPQAPKAEKPVEAKTDEVNLQKKMKKAKK
jgi:hypothetical protein